MKEGLQVYDRPVYFGTEIARAKTFDDVHDQDTERLVYVWMFFTGRRWVMSYCEEDEDNVCQTGTLYDNSNFHAYWMDLNYRFISEPSDIYTDSYGATPIGLKWHEMVGSHKIGIPGENL